MQGGDSLENRGSLALQRTSADPCPETDPFPRGSDLERIGKVMEAFARRFDDILTPMTTHAERILSPQTGGPETRIRAEMIASAGRRGASVIRRLQRSFGGSRLEPRPLDLNTVVTGTVPRILAGSGPGIVLEMRLSPRLHRAYADPDGTEELVRDLIANSCEAMPHGGRLIVETEGIEVDRLRFRHGVMIAPGSYAALNVWDTGAGMDAGTRARAFDPFFTTKPGALGLGLSSAYGFVKQSAGCIWINGYPGNGALVTVYLPCLSPEAAEGFGTQRTTSP